MFFCRIYCRQEIETSQENSKREKNSTDSVIDPVPHIEASPPSPVLPPNSSPPSDPKDMDIDDKQNLAFESLPESQPPINDVDEQDKQIGPPNTHATIDDKQTSQPDSHLPNDVSNEHGKQIPPFTMENKQTSPHESPSPIQQNLSSEKKTNLKLQTKLSSLHRISMITRNTLM